MKLTVKHEGKVYGFLRCSEESVPKLKILASQLGFPSMVSLIDTIASLPKGRIRALLNDNSQK